MLLEAYFGPRIYSQPIGDITTEVYRAEEGFQVFLVGDHIAAFLGTAPSLKDCKEEIRALEALAEAKLSCDCEVGKTAPPFTRPHIRPSNNTDDGNSEPFGLAQNKLREES